MKLVIGLLALKLVALAGAIATTFAFVGLFAFRETLGPHVVTLFLGGFAAIAIGEGGAWLLARKAASEAEDGDADA